MIITKKWIIVIPRKQEKALDQLLELNALGIMGGVPLHVTRKSEFQKVKKTPFEDILKEVTFEL